LGPFSVQGSLVLHPSNIKNVTLKDVDFTGPLSIPSLNVKQLASQIRSGLNGIPTIVVCFCRGWFSVSISNWQPSFSALVPQGFVS
jgi:hypothetical protein